MSLLLVISTAETCIVPVASSLTWPHMQYSTRTSCPDLWWEYMFTVQRIWLLKWPRKVSDDIVRSVIVKTTSSNLICLVTKMYSWKLLVSWILLFFLVYYIICHFFFILMMSTLFGGVCCLPLILDTQKNGDSSHSHLPLSFFGFHTSHPMATIFVACNDGYLWFFSNLKPSYFSIYSIHSIPSRSADFYIFLPFLVFLQVLLYRHSCHSLSHLAFSLHSLQWKFNGVDET